ncbi:MAG: transcriptional regulator [Deltaproteobacteria bacterium]|nr:transcriptional regulator [Deltaproteobacteria bacterium]
MSGDVAERLKLIEERLGVLERLVARGSTGTSKALTSTISIDNLLSLPSSLQKTMMAIQELKEGTANEVAEVTERSRSVETIYLNQLARMGYLTRQRRGHRVYFKLLKYY